MPLNFDNLKYFIILRLWKIHITTFFGIIIILLHGTQYQEQNMLLFFSGIKELDAEGVIKSSKIETLIHIINNPKSIK